MDNLRLEHPATYSTHSQAGIHHLLPFTPPSIEFSPQLSRPSINNAQQNSIPFSTSWASLLTEPQYAQNSNALLKHGMQSPDRAIRTWDFTADSTLQHKQETSVDIAAEFPHYSSASLEEFSRESPNLQLKHGKDVIATEFGHLNASMHVLRGDACNFLSDNAVNDSRKDGFHLPGLLVAVDKGDASPLSVVSGVQPASFACKADPSTGRDHMFMSIDWHDRDDSVRALKETPVIMKTERVGESSIGLIESFKGSHDKDCSDIDERGIIVKKEQDAGVTIASLEDGSIGLRLGKRTYYGDGGGGGGEESSRRAHNSSTHENGTGAKNGNSSNSSIVSFTTTTHAAVTATATGNINPVAHTVTTVKNNSGGVVLSKKQKGSSAFTAVPMCQAEGCTADLSGAKDYHRRHKVCEWHSKASKTKVNNLEQRFCQQCSRFHILSAFDEGKRSCRRRLAGHNERRRKPPPEPMPLLTPGGFAYFADGRVNALHEHPYFLQHGRPSIAPCSMDNPVLACQLGRAGFPKQEIAGSHRALELHRYMQGLPPGAGSGVGALDDGGTLMLANGDSVALPTALSLPARASFSSVGLLPHVSSEMAISGRALSLLSPSLGSPETMSISLGMTTTSIDQILLDTHPLTASCQQLVPKSNQCFSSGIGMLSALRGHSQRQNHTLNSLTSSSSGCSTEIDQGERSMSNFEGRSLFLADSDNSFKTMQDCGNSHNGRPMLNLMQISPESSHRHHQQQQPDFPYVDLTGLSIFNRQNIM